MGHACVRMQTHAHTWQAAFKLKEQKPLHELGKHEKLSRIRHIFDVYDESRRPKDPSLQSVTIDLATPQDYNYTNPAAHGSHVGVMRSACLLNGTVLGLPATTTVHCSVPMAQTSEQ